MKNIFMLKQLEDVEKLQRTIISQLGEVEEALVNTEEQMREVREECEDLNTRSQSILNKITEIEEEVSDNLSTALENIINEVSVRAVTIDKKVEDL